jgi:hypothetical protein
MPKLHFQQVFENFFIVNRLVEPLWSVAVAVGIVKARQGTKEFRNGEDGGAALPFIKEVTDRVDRIALVIEVGLEVEFHTSFAFLPGMPSNAFPC